MHVRAHGTKLLMMAVTLAASVLWTAPAFAAPITFDEALDHDLDPGNLTVFTFDVGTNTVKGLQAFTGGDRDSFGFILPAGLQLTALTLQVINDSAAAGFRLGTGIIENGGTQLDFLSAANGQTDAITPALLPLGAGSYNIAWTFISNDPSYLFTAQVARQQTSPVPEPGSLLLLCTGGAALLAKVRRRRKADA